MSRSAIVGAALWCCAGLLWIFILQTTTAQSASSNLQSAVGDTLVAQPRPSGVGHSVVDTVTGRTSDFLTGTGKESRVGAPKPPAPTIESGDCVNVNTASAEQLQKINGIGPVLAQRIIEMRSKTPLRGTNDLLAVRGIGPVKLEKFRKQICF